MADINLKNLVAILHTENNYLISAENGDTNPGLTLTKVSPIPMPVHPLPGTGTDIPYQRQQELNYILPSGLPSNFKLIYPHNNLPIDFATYETLDTLQVNQVLKETGRLREKGNIAIKDTAYPPPKTPKEDVAPTHVDVHNSLKVTSISFDYEGKTPDWDYKLLISLSVDSSQNFRALPAKLITRTSLSDPFQNHKVLILFIETVDIANRQPTLNYGTADPIIINFKDIVENQEYLPILTLLGPVPAVVDDSTIIWPNSIRKKAQINIIRH